MIRKYYLKDPDTGELFLLPDTPPGFSFSSGRNVEKLEMAQVGEIHLPGADSLFERPLEFLLPCEAGRSYAPSSWGGETYPTVEKLVGWSQSKTVLRLIVTGTSVNYPVLLGPVEYGESDGTNDVKITLTFYRYRYVGQEATQRRSTGNKGRSSETKVTGTSAYTVKHGDTLWSVCRKHYGNGYLQMKLAAYNGIKNANVIHSGQRLKLPPASALR